MSADAATDRDRPRQVPNRRGMGSAVCEPRRRAQPIGRPQRPRRALNPSIPTSTSTKNVVARWPLYFYVAKQQRSVAFVVLLQHENSNDVALVCATTKPHTVVCPLVMEQAIAYLRVSTQRQHRSGLGIDAQRAAIERFAATESLTIVSRVVEAETGKGADALDRRPQLAAPWPPQRPRSAVSLLPSSTGFRVTWLLWPA